ncbi:MAG TPA: adenylosuccinate synthetase [Planctomycetaceae bacterium]|jgi:adenylosuccinate synthase|nr:adenylosuccinate synthetase [Planctomycetaceae bacterium]
MQRLIVVLTGPVASGKSSLAQKLVERFHFEQVKTRELIRTRFPDVDASRDSFQQLGEQLDRENDGDWISHDIDKLARERGWPADARIVIDAVRIQEQIKPLRKWAHVFHVHLTAPYEVLERRYNERISRHDIREFDSYAQVRENQTEARIETLRDDADISIDSQQCTEEDVLVRVAAAVRLFGRGCNRQVDVVVGGGYGSEGKGQLVAYLAPEYDLLIRVGGPNAGHKVYEEEAPYTFRSLPSGTRNCKAPILIGAGAYILLDVLLREIAECELTAERLSIDPQATIISESDRKAEARIKRAIGSTAQGVGAATARRIFFRAHKSRQVQTAIDIPELKPFVRDTYEIIERECSRGHRILLEGTQGTGLSLYHGHYPHVTSRDTTVSGCMAESGIAPGRVRRVIMVCRTYPIRVGGPSGYMSQEISFEEIQARSGVPLEEMRDKEKGSVSGTQRRISEFDWVQFQKAVFLNAPTDIALTFSDYISIKNRDARRFEQLTPETLRFIESVETVASVPVSLISTRFDSRSIIDRRSW